MSSSFLSFTKPGKWRWNSVLIGSMTRLRVVSHAATSARAGAASRARGIGNARGPPLPLERPMPTLTSAEASEASGELAGRERLHAEVELMADRPIDFKAELLVGGESVVLHAVLREARDLSRELLGFASRFAVRNHAVRQ